jgi:hypothetical protein
MYLSTVVVTVLCFVALIFSAAEYLIAVHNVEIVRSLTPAPHEKVLRLDADTPSSSESEALLRMLHAQHEELKSMHAALMRIAMDRKAAALWHCAAWIMLSMSLALLTIKLKPLRKQN